MPKEKTSPLVMCPDCIFWFGHEYRTQEARLTSGTIVPPQHFQDCHGRKPQAVLIEGGTEWPRTEANEGCGEGMRK